MSTTQMPPPRRFLVSDAAVDDCGGAVYLE